MPSGLLPAEKLPRFAPSLARSLVTVVFRKILKSSGVDSKLQWFGHYLGQPQDWGAYSDEENCSFRAQRDKYFVE